MAWHPADPVIRPVKHDVIDPNPLAHLQIGTPPTRWLGTPLTGRPAHTAKPGAPGLRRPGAR
jgi:hypothetical protein